MATADLASGRGLDEAERAIEASGVPCSIVRATQFRDLLDGWLSAPSRWRLLLVPRGLKFQLLDSGEAADRLVMCVTAEPGGRLPDIGGPEVLSSEAIAAAWRSARGRWLIPLRLPTPGRIADAYRRGFNCAPDNPVGSINWRAWLAAKYSRASAS